MVLTCTGCPRPSRSPAPSPRSIARAVADELGLEPDQVARVLAAAKAHRGRLKAERSQQPNAVVDPPTTSWGLVAPGGRVDNPIPIGP